MDISVYFEKVFLLKDNFNEIKKDIYKNVKAFLYSLWNC
jgi:hypothetical protein